MSITVKLGICTEDPRKLDKSVNFFGNNPTEISAILKDNCGIMTPVFIVSPGSINISRYNYCYVPSWGRYYYIIDMVAMTGSRIAVKCDEDVLSSNAAAINDLQLYLNRTATDVLSSEYMGDDGVPAELRRRCITLDFNTTPFTANYGSDTVYLLTVLGGTGQS